MQKKGRAIMMAERLEAYQFMLQFIKEVAPQRPLENVYVVTDSIRFQH